MDFATLRPLFENSQVQKALLIDDAFDPLPPVDEQDLQKAIALIEKDDDVERAWLDTGGKWPATLAEIGELVRTGTDVRNGLREALAAKERHPLKALARHLVGHASEVQAGKLAPLEALKKVLSEVGIEPSEIGSEGKPDQKYPLIFLDYYLGDDDQPSVERSIERIRALLTDYGHDEMPIVVLMSSLEKNPDRAEDFRKRAELLGCQFKFVPKNQFATAAFEVISSLADRAEHLSQARDLSHFVKVWRDSLNNAIDTFTADIRSLDLQDFYFIWKKAGEGKNQRFGEHVSGMFDNYLRKLLEEQTALIKVQEKVSSIKFPKMPPSPSIPSATVARFAHASAFMDLEPFPQDHVQPLGVALGDVFISESISGTGRRRQTVLSAMIVISQSCDLEHGKVGTILMVEGTVQKRSAAKSTTTAGRERTLRLDIFHYRNSLDEVEDFIIEWDAQKLKAYSVLTFHDDMRRGHFQRVARMRSVQALAMQQKFSAQLTRVGMPDAMPVYRYGGLEVFVRRARGGPWEQLATIQRDQRPACIVGEENPDLIITEDALARVRTALDEAVPADGADDAMKGLQTELNNVANLRKLRQAKLGKGKVAIGSIQLTDSPLSNEELGKLNTRVMMVMSVRSE